MDPEIRRRGIAMQLTTALARPHWVIHWVRVCHRNKFRATLRVSPETLSLLYHAPYDIHIKSAPKLDFLCIPDYRPEAVTAAANANPVDLLSHLAAVMHILSAAKAGKLPPPRTKYVDCELHW